MWPRRTLSDLANDKLMVAERLFRAVTVALADARYRRAARGIWLETMWGWRSYTMSMGTPRLQSREVADMTRAEQGLALSVTTAVAD